MNYDQFTLKTQDALQQASSLAQQNDHSEVGLEHILATLLEQKDGMIPPLVERIGVQPGDVLAGGVSEQLHALTPPFPERRRTWRAGACRSARS